MIYVSDKFFPMAQETERTWCGKVSFALFDVTAKGDAAAAAEQQPFSDVSKTLDTITDVVNYGTCEKDQFRLDGSMELFSPTGNFGWWSKEISDVDGNFANPPAITYTFTKPHSSIGLTLIFAELVQDITAKAYNDETIIQTKDFTGLNTSLAVLDFPVENYTKLVIEIHRALPFHYAKLLEINFGIEYVYDDEKESLLNYDVLEDIDLMSNQLSSNTMTVTLNNMDQRFNMFNPKNEVRFLQERQKLSVSAGLLVDGKFEDIPLGVFYLSTWDSPTASTTKFTANDIISLMTGTYYKSRLYDHERGEAILKELLDAAGLYDEQGNPLYYIHPNIRNVTLSGYIAPMRYRDALQRIAFALGAVVKTDRYGKVLIYRATEETRNAIVIDKHTPYQGTLIAGTFGAGQGIVLPRRAEPLPNPAVIDRSLYQTPKTTLGKYYNQVNVQCYGWKLKSEVQNLYEGTITGDTIITFSAFPAAEVTISGTYGSAEIYACACVLHGTNGKITITGKVYEAAAKTISVCLPEVTESVTPNALDIKEVTLIGQDDTAQSVAGWILAQLQNRITQSFKWWTNPAVEASDFVKVETAFGEYRESQIKKMHFTYNGALTGDSEVIG